MSVNTPLGDSLDVYLASLLAGKSAVTHWKAFDTAGIYGKVGADLSGYDIAKAVDALAGLIPEDIHGRLRRLDRRAPWSTRHSLLLAARGFLDAGLFDHPPDPTRVAAIIAGHNINVNYQYEQRIQFAEEPDFIDALHALHGLDTDHAGSVSELLGMLGPIYTVGSACASGNAALRCAVDEIRHHGADVALVLGAVLDFSPIDIHAMALMGAITYQSFNDDRRPRQPPIRHPTRGLRARARRRHPCAREP